MHDIDEQIMRYFVVGNLVVFIFMNAVVELNPNDTNSRLLHKTDNAQAAHVSEAVS